MGWDFTYDASRRDIIEYVTKGDEKTKCLARAARGNVLWAVFEQESVEPKRFIVCFLLQRSKIGWGYKDMDESMHPYQYSCPESFLEMTPVACEPWRALVRQEAAKGRRKLTVGLWYALPNRRPNKIRIVSLSPLRGFAENGLMYKVSKKMLGEEVPCP